MTIIFDVEELRKVKHDHPEWVLLIGDKTKSPQRIVGKWKELTSQTPRELEALIVKVQNSEIEAWNYGPRTGLNNLACLDFDWEFLAYKWQKKLWERAKTETYLTPNKGYRMLFYTTERENSSPYKATLHMEFENDGYVAIGGHAEDVEGRKQPYTRVRNGPIKIDNTIIQDTKLLLADQLQRYDFLQYKCVHAKIDAKHIKLDHTQRLAVLQFMLAKNFEDEEVHDFFRTVYET